MALSSEAKVGLFTLSGLAVFAAGILLLGDIRFQKQYPLYVLFDNAEGLPINGPVKVAGVDVGQISEVKLEGERARVKIQVKKDLGVHRDAGAYVASTGLIGSKYLDLTLGSPQEPLLQPGDTIEGAQGMSFNDILRRVGEFFKEDPATGNAADNLRQTIANFRQVSQALANSIGQQEEQMTEIVENIRALSAHAKQVAANLQDITDDHKVDVKVTLTKFRSISERLDDILERVQGGKGLMGKLVSDEQMGDELKQTMSNVKQVSKDLESFTGRIARIQIYWDYRQRYDFEEKQSRADLGLRMEPRPGKFYFIQGNNLGGREDRKDDPEADLEKKNTVTAVMGADWGPLTVYGGAIRSAGGAGVRLRPFPKSSSWNRRVEFEGEAYDFGRDEVIQGIKMDKPYYNAGLRVNAVAPWVWVGAGVEDIAVRKNFNANVNVTFRDEDIAFLLGLVGLAR